MSNVGALHFNHPELLIEKILYILSITSKGKSQNGCFKKTKHIKFSEENEHFLPPDAHKYIELCITCNKVLSTEIETSSELPEISLKW